MRARLHSNRRPLPRVTHRPASRGEGALLKGPRGSMLAAGVPRALCRLVARRCPAGLPPSRPAWRGGARGGEEGGGGTGSARRRRARPVGGAVGFLGGEAGRGRRAGAGAGRRGRRSPSSRSPLPLPQGRRGGRGGRHYPAAEESQGEAPSPAGPRRYLSAGPGGRAAPRLSPLSLCSSAS